jgi:hypothetical protein
LSCDFIAAVRSARNCALSSAMATTYAARQRVTLSILTVIDRMER